MTVPVPVQVAQGLPVGEPLLLGVVRGRPYELKHRLPHVQKLVEDVGDGVIPAALEERQAGWSHGFLVFLVEIKSAEGPLGQLIAG